MTHMPGVHEQQAPCGCRETQRCQGGVCFPIVEPRHRVSRWRNGSYQLKTFLHKNVPLFQLGAQINLHIYTYIYFIYQFGLLWRVLCVCVQWSAKMKSVSTTLHLSISSRASGVVGSFMLCGLTANRHPLCGCVPLSKKGS